MAAVREGTVVRFYVDGQLDGEAGGFDPGALSLDQGLLFGYDATVAWLRVSDCSRYGGSCLTTPTAQ